MERSALPRPPAHIDQTMYCPRADRAVDIDQCFACSWSRAPRRGENVLPVVCAWRGDPYRRLLDDGFIV